MPIDSTTPAPQNPAADPKADKDYFNTFLITAQCGTAAIVALFYISDAVTANTISRSANNLIIIFGLVLGWGTGMYLSPYSEEEASKFVTAGQAISVFISGYALAKVDRLVESSLFTQSNAANYENWVKVGMFVTAFLIMSVMVFAAREYLELDQTTTKRQSKAKKSRSAKPDQSPAAAPATGNHTDTADEVNPAPVHSLAHPPL